MSEPVFITSEELIERWNGAVTKWTLERWRSRGQGPHFNRFGNRVMYALRDVEQYEAESRRVSTRRKES